MASRIFKQFFYSFNTNPVLLEGQFTVNSAQTSDTNNYKTSSRQGTGLLYAAQVGTGVYKLSLTDVYFKFLGAQFCVSGVPNVASHVAVASLVAGTPYVIDAVGTTSQADWVLAGVPLGVTAAVGVAFVAAAGASGAAGTGFASPVKTSGIANAEIFGVPDLTINPQIGTSPYLMFQTYYATASNSTPLIPANPVDGSVIRYRLLLRNSGQKGSGE